MERRKFVKTATLKMAGITTLISTKNIFFENFLADFISTSVDPAIEAHNKKHPNYIADWPAEFSKCAPVPLNKVHVQGFLGKRVASNLQSIFEGLQSACILGFEERVAGGERKFTVRSNADSDLYKWVEGASYMYIITGNKDLEKELDRISGLIKKAQHPDGYINTMDPKNGLNLYIAGHFFEAATAHYHATGKRILLDVASQWADFLLQEFNNNNTFFNPDNISTKVHSVYELGLSRLARATGESKYFKFASELALMFPVDLEIFQGEFANKSHAVCINYLLSGYADLYLGNGNSEFNKELVPIWEDIVTRRSYVTGGVSVHERYTKPYYLPQVTDHIYMDIAETCTSISLVMFAWRMHAITGESRVFDQIETTLYNHLLGGVSLDHMGTFYHNPLKMLELTEGKTDHRSSLTQRTRLPEVHDTSCCITNEWRFFGELGEYLYSFDNNGVYINLYTSGSVNITLPTGIEASFDVITKYPHDGEIFITSKSKIPENYSINLRIPTWCKAAVLSMPDGQKQKVTGGKYINIERTWNKDDRVVLNLEMPVRMIHPVQQDKENAGQAVLARGPLVYCLEQTDVSFDLSQTCWNISSGQVEEKVKTKWEPELLGGIYTLIAPVSALGKSYEVPFIPFYARANRGKSHWLTYLPMKESVRK